MKKRPDSASILLVILMTFCLFFPQFMFKSSARIGQKVSLTASETLGSGFYILLIFTVLLLGLILVKGEKENFNLLTVFWAGICFGTLVFLSGGAVGNVELGGEFRRISMSFGCYLYLILAFLIQTNCAQKVEHKGKKALAVSIGFFLAFAALFSGKLDGLSVMVEYLNRKEQFQEEFLNHIKMAFGVVITGILIGIPLGWLAYNRQRAGRIIFSVLNTLESIPPLALICVMMFPLAFLSNNIEFLRNMGVSGVGATPVFFALLFYSLFQIVNSMYGALKVIDREYIEVARAMGMSGKQIFFKVELPIILPILISGIRVSLITSILGVTIGAYVGFGGLGMFILQGITGFAIDIVLMVTIPIMFTIFFADFVLKELVIALEEFRKYRGRVRI